MKNLILTMALVLALSANAIPTKTNFKLVKSDVVLNSLTEVDAFCKLIQQGNYEAVKSMIAAGIDINKVSVGLTPVMYAARHNKVEILNLLIANGANLKTKSDRGYTALQLAKMSKAHEAVKAIEKAIKERKEAKKQKAA